MLMCEILSAKVMSFHFATGPRSSSMECWYWTFNCAVSPEGFPPAKVAPCDQPGLTTTKITTAMRMSVGTSLNQRKYTWERTLSSVENRFKCRWQST